MTSSQRVDDAISVESVVNLNPDIIIKTSNFTTKMHTENDYDRIAVVIMDNKTILSTVRERAWKCWEKCMAKIQKWMKW